jgi:hypothetical protein
VQKLGTHVRAPAVFEQVRTLAKYCKSQKEGASNYSGQEVQAIFYVRTPTSFEQARTLAKDCVNINKVQAINLDERCKQFSEHQTAWQQSA